MPDPLHLLSICACEMDRFGAVSILSAELFILVFFPFEASAGVYCKEEKKGRERQRPPHSLDGRWRRAGIQKLQAERQSKIKQIVRMGSVTARVPAKYCLSINRQVDRKESDPCGKEDHP